MLIDLLGMDNYVSFNIYVADILGLHAAVYISELLNINGKAVKKSKVNDNYFTVDRKYIKKRTTLDEAEQHKIDKQLLDIGLLKISEESPNTITLDITVLTSLFCGNEDIVKDLKKRTGAAKKTNTTGKKTRKEQEIELLKTYIVTTNVELHNAYCDWIDAVYNKLGWMSKKAVTVGEKLVDESSTTPNGKRSLDIALKILEIATVNGYKDMTWAVKMFNDNYKPNYIVQVMPSQPDRSVSLSEEVF